jgi:hypothetical protein
MATNKAKKASEKKEAGRPKEIEGGWRKVTTILSNDQLRRFNDIEVQQRQKNPLSSPLSRNEIVRASLDALFNSGIDIATFTNEKDLRAAIEKLRGKRS